MIIAELDPQLIERVAGVMAALFDSMDEVMQTEDIDLATDAFVEFFQAVGSIYTDRKTMMSDTAVLVTFVEAMQPPMGGGKVH